MRTGRVLTGLLLLIAAISFITFLITMQPSPAIPALQQATTEASSAVAMDPDILTVRVLFGLRDEKPSRWTGAVTLSEGTLHGTAVWREGPGDSIADAGRFQLQTRTVSQGRNRRVVTENGLLLSVEAPDSAQVLVSTNQGEFRFRVGELAASGRLVRMERNASVDVVASPAEIASTAREEDFPAAAAADDGAVYAVYVEHEHVGAADLNPMRTAPADFSEFQPSGGGDRLMMTAFDGRQWSSLGPVTDEGLDLWRPAVAVDGQGQVWVVWSQRSDDNWDLFARQFDPQRKSWTGGARRLTTDAGADVHVVAARARSGAVWLAWQAWRNGNFDIQVATIGPDGLIQRSKLGADATNQWSPAIAADGKGIVYVAFDSYEDGNYDIHLATIPEAGEASDATRPVADTPRFEVRPSLVCDADDRLWIAWEERAVNWGKDNWGAIQDGPGSALYRSGSAVRVACLADGQFKAPLGDVAANFRPDNLQRMNGYPRLGTDPAGRVWLALRHREQRRGTAGTYWQSYLTTYEGTEWGAPTLIPYSDNLLDNRPVLLGREAGRLLVVYSGDGRNRYSRRQFLNNQLFAAHVKRPGKVQPPEFRAARPASDGAEEEAKVDEVHPNEWNDIRRMRDFRLRLGNKEYRLMRGEFHRHTEISGDGGGDGSLEDMWRYGLDAARMDWIGNGDHDNGGGREYTWWITQKTTDIFHHPPDFVPMFTYERSVRYPDGHRNVMFARRGVRTLPRLQPQAGENKPNNVSAQDTPMLYRYLKQLDGICAVHTSATDMGTDWRDNDPQVEPIVEIYQGDRHNYEHFGAPRSATQQTQVGGFQPDGFVWNALEKGYRLGFQASSDHISTHISYAVAVVQQPTREGILDAFQKRHCYGATDNIVLIVRSGDQLMGDEFTTDKRPRLDITAIGTLPIARLSVIRDLKYAYTTGPGQREVNTQWTDHDASPGTTSLYYVRIEQEDGQIAWASPMWITYQP